MNILYTKATEKDYDELVEFANYVFGGIDFPVELPKLYKKEYDTMPQHYIVKVDNKIKAAMGAFPMEIDILGEKLKVRGIGTVSVHPEYRGSGYMKDLMNLALEDMKKDGIHMSCLGGQRQRYEYFSYTPCGQRVNFYISKTSIRHRFGNKINDEIIFYKVHENDFYTIDKMFELYNNEKVKVLREKKKFLDTLKSWKYNVYAITKQGEVIGYMSLSDDKTSINELIVKYESDFIDVIAAHIKVNNIHGINMGLPLYEKNKLKCVQELCESYHIGNSYQFTVLDYEKVIRALLKLKSTYSRVKDGEVNLEIKDYGTIAISVQGSKINVTKTDEKYHISLNHLEAMQFLFSPLSSYFELSENIPECLESWLPLPLFIAQADTV